MGLIDNQNIQAQKLGSSLPLKEALTIIDGRWDLEMIKTLNPNNKAPIPLKSGVGYLRLVTWFGRNQGF